MRQALGIESVGIFWYIIERMAQAGGKLPMKIIPVLAMQMQVTEPKVYAVVTNYELFEIENEIFFSRRLQLSLGLRETLQIAGKKGAEKRWGSKEEVKQPKLKF